MRMRRRDLDSILEQSLAQIAAGEARVQSCLLSYPALADELEPLLLTAEELRALPRPILSEEARARIEKKTLAAVRVSPWRRLTDWLQSNRSRLRWAHAGLAAALAVIVLIPVLIYAASAALPGSLLYPVKLATEEVQLRLAPERIETELHLSFARRRLEEFEELARQGDYSPSILSALRTEAESIMAHIPGLPPAAALPILMELAGFTSHETQSLSAWLDKAPPEVQGALRGAIEASKERADLVQRMISALRPEELTEPVRTPVATYTSLLTPTPDLTLSPHPVATLVPTGTSEPTATLRPSNTPAPTETLELRSTPEPPPALEPTSTAKPTQAKLPTDTTEPTKSLVPPGQTKTPQPPGQTKTPQPPGQTKEP
jgi:hypothetical protein